GGPVDRAEHDAVGGVLGQLHLEHRQPQAVDDGVLIHRYARVRVARRLGVDAVDVEANAGALEQLRLFLELEAVAQATVDVALQHGRVGQHLLGRLEPVGDGGDVGRGQVEHQGGFRLAVAGVLRHNIGAVGEAGLLDVLHRVGASATPVEQVADEQPALRGGNHARNAGGLDEVTSAGGVGGEGRLNRHGERALGAGQGGGAGLELVRLGDDLAHGFGAGAVATAGFQPGDDLLDGLEVGLQLALLDQQLVDLGLGLFAHGLVALDIGLGLLGVGFQVVTDLFEIRLDLLVFLFDLGHGCYLNGEKGD